jgi:opacity protein-like surface antigen
MQTITKATLAAAFAAPLLATSPSFGDDGAYVGLRGGASLFEDTQFGVSGATVTNEYDRLGYGVSGVAGYEVEIPETRFGYRVELEGGYTQAEINSHNVSGAGTFTGGDASGDTSVLYGFVNTYADVNVAPKVDVFAGAGAGVGDVELDGHGTSATGRVMKDREVAFGYHIDAGASYEVSDNITLETMYRWQNFVDADLRATDGTKTNLDLASHNVYAGLRYKF